MSIENDVFKRSKVNFNKLIKYGFIKEKDKYIYNKLFLDDDFMAEIIIDSNKNITGKVIEKEMNEEYTNIRLENITGEFVNKVKDEYINILNDIKDKCFDKSIFIYDQTNRITEYIKNKYDDTPEFLWDDNTTGVFRNKFTKKWYGIIMNINKSKLDKENKDIEVMNVKNESLKEKKINGIYKAYHMNKEKWISISLDDTLDDKEIIKLIDESYNLINEKEIWIVPANPKYYDVVGAFKNKDTIEWKQSSNINVGDIVYLYVAEPYSSILYKCIATEVNIPYDYQDKNIKMTHLMRIKKEEEFNKDKVTFKYLNELGIKAIRGPRKITKEISNKIDKKNKSAN